MSIAMRETVEMTKMAEKDVEHERFFIYSKREIYKVQMSTTWRQKWVEIRSRLRHWLLRRFKFTVNRRKGRQNGMMLPGNL